MNNRIKYLESLLPINEVILQERYFDKFEKYATHTNNGTYHWLGIRSSIWIYLAHNKEDE